MTPDCLHAGMWGKYRGMAFNLSLALAYVVTGKLGLFFATTHGSVTLIWMPAGIALAALVFRGAPCIPGVMLGAFLIDYYSGSGSVFFALIAMAGSTLSACAGAFFLRRVIGFRPEMDRVKDMLGLLGLASALSTTLAATFGVAALCLAKGISRSNFPHIWVDWWVGDAMGILMVAPVLFTLKGLSLRGCNHRRVIEMAAILAGASVFSVAAFIESNPPESKLAMLLTIPFMILAAFRFGPPGVAMVNFAVAATATAEIAHSTERVCNHWMEKPMIILWFFIMVGGMTAQVMVAALMQRRRSEESLRASEERYRRLYNGTPAMLHSIDREGRICSVSDAWLATLGYSRDEVLGRYAADFLTKDSRRQAVETILPEFFRTGVCQNVSYQMMTKDGRVIDVLLSAVGERDVSGKMFRSLTVINNVTERVRMENELRQSRDRFSQIAENSRELIWEVDADGLYTYVNGVCEQLLACRREEMIGKMHFHDLAPPQSREASKRNILDLIRRGEPFHDVIVTVQTRDGRMVWLSVSGVPVLDGEKKLLGYRGAGVDITARREAEERIRRSEELFRSVVETSPDGITITNMEGRLTFASPKALLMFGYKSLKEVLGRNIMEFIAPDFHGKAAALLADLCRGRSVKTTECPAMKQDGARFWIESSGQVLRNDADNPSAMLFIMRNITERKQLEEEWHQAQKMDAVGRLAGGVAHDFNNLLMVIGGQARLLLRNLGKEDPNRKRAEAIRQASDQAALITRQLLTLSRKQTVQIVPVDLAALLSEIDALLHNVAGEKVKLVAIHPTGDAIVEADPLQLQQVLINLVSNARDAVSNGGTIRIEMDSLSITEFDPLHPDLPTGEYLTLHVRDNGQGMGPDVKARLFEPFFTTKSKGKGTGLGLSTAYGIVRQFGGMISVQSEIGSGSTFSVVLPRSKRTPSPLRPGIAATSLSNPGAGTRGTILLVEDDHDVRATVREMLENNSFRVIEAAGGHEALGLLQSFSDTVHLMLTDIMMPVMNGDQLTEIVRKLRPEMRVIFMSGYASDVIHRDDLTRKGHRLLHKPVDEEELVGQIRMVLLNQ